MTKNNISVLIVDNDPDSALVVRDSIEGIAQVDNRICVASDVKTAFFHLEDKTFDIVLTEYQLGDITGIDLIDSLRKGGIQTPVIVLTQNFDRDIDQKALEAGAADYIRKSDLSGPIIDHAIGYAIANATQQNYLSSVIHNAKAAICVYHPNRSPHIWNAEFSKLADKLLEKEQGDAHIKTFASTVTAVDADTLLDIIKHEKQEAKLPNGGCVVTLHDVSAHVEALDERRLAQEKADVQAKTCFLTGLPNRLAFNEKLKSVINAGEKFTLLNIDLDKFKGYNDLYGHAFGDSILTELSEILRSCRGPNDFLARVGGDEFIAIQLHDKNGQRKKRFEKTVISALGKELVIDGRPVDIELSIGAADFPEHGNTEKILMANADMAMYRAKVINGSHTEYFDTSFDDAARKRRSLTADLEAAISNDEIDVYFQPQFDLKSNNIIGCEALARWVHPTHGFISPEVFIDMAEDAGVIEELGKLILRKSCILAQQWANPIKVSVNISGVQILRTKFVHDVQTILLETGLPAKLLELQVKESVLMTNVDHTLHVLRGIRNLGVDLAIDDFGTGFSSLSTLISFQFNKLKIDRSFVTNMEKREQLKSVIRTCVGLGKNLDLRIIAEGVEEESHITFLREIGCDEVQGYCLGKPMPQQKFIEFLEHADNFLGNVNNPDIKIA